MYTHAKVSDLYTHAKHKTRLVAVLIAFNVSQRDFIVPASSLPNTIMDGDACFVLLEKPCASPLQEDTKTCVAASHLSQRY